MSQNQALTLRGASSGVPLEDCEPEAPTHDLSADSSNKSKESYAVFYIYVYLLINYIN